MWRTIIAHGAAGALLPDAIELVNEQDAGRGLAGLLEHVPYAAGAHANNDLHELRACRGVEGHACLSRYGLGQQCFPCTHAFTFGILQSQDIDLAP